MAPKPLQEPPEREGLPLHGRHLWAVLAVNTRAAAFARAARSLGLERAGAVAAADVAAQRWQ